MGAGGSHLGEWMGSFAARELRFPYPTPDPGILMHLSVTPKWEGAAVVRGCPAHYKPQCSLHHLSGISWAFGGFLLWKGGRKPLSLSYVLSCSGEMQLPL